MAGIIAVYASLFGIGKLIFGDWASGFGLVAVAVGAFAWIARSFRNEEAATVGPEARPVEAD